MVCYMPLAHDHQITPQLLLQQIAQIPHMERGKLCVLRAGPQGPYTTTRPGKRVGMFTKFTFRRTRSRPMQQAIAGYERFQI